MADRCTHHRVAFGAGLAMALALGLSSGAGAATLSLTGGVLGLSVGPFETVSIGQSPDPVPVSVSSGGGSFLGPANLFSGTATLPTQLFTGVPVIDSFHLVGLAQGSLNATGSGGLNGGFGGSAGVGGTAILGVLGGLVNIVIPLSVVGAGGVVPTAAAALLVTVTGNLWTTGAVQVVGITTTTPSGQAVNTATFTGSDARTAGHAGTITLVTPIRVLSNAFGNLPAFASQTLTFVVPEPGSLLLLGAGAVALVRFGWRRRGGG